MSLFKPLVLDRMLVWPAVSSYIFYARYVWNV